MKYILTIITILILASCAMPTSEELQEQGLIVSAQVPDFDTVDAYFRWVYYNISYAYDETTYGRDYWQTPQETLVSRTGDCEDYVILFLFLLDNRLNIQGDMVIFRVESEQSYHATARVDGLYYDFGDVLSFYDDAQAVAVYSYQMTLYLLYNQ